MSKSRRTAVPSNVFVAEYKSALQNDMTTAELAAKLNMPAVQVSGRVSQLRKRLKEAKGVDLPKLRRTPRVGNVNEVLDDLADFVKE